MEWHRVLIDLAPIASGITFLIGLMAIFAPQKSSKQFGVEVQGSALAYVVGLGIRDIFIGFVFLLLWWLGDAKLLGAASFGVALVGASDFIVVTKNGSKKSSLVHFLGTMGALIYGVLLIL